MENKLIIFGNFVFLDVTEKAKEIFNSGLFELYELHAEGEVDSIIESISTLNKVLENGNTVGIEVGHLNLHIGILDVYKQQRTLVSLQEDGLLVESSTDKSPDVWEPYSPNLDVSISFGDRVFDDSDSLLKESLDDSKVLHVGHKQDTKISEDVYCVISDDELEGDVDLTSIGNPEFLKLAEEVGRVYNKQEFQEAFNECDVNTAIDYFRIITRYY